MTSREAYGSSAGLHHSGQPLPVIQNMRAAYGSDGGGALYKPPLMSMSPSYQGSPRNGGTVDGFHNGFNMNIDMGSGDAMKRKRGRPRKYGPDEGMALAVVPPIQAFPAATQSPGIFSPLQSDPAPPPPQSGPVSPTSVKKRGRPRGSTNKKKRESGGPTGAGFIPHIITVNAGEDVSAKIIAFSQHSSRAVCILSASGAISNVTLRQPATSGGTVTCEGRFEILSLSGSFFLTESYGQRMRSGGLSVSLCGPYGRVMGGGVAGLLIAASPVQVIVGSFNVDGRGKDSKTPLQKEPTSEFHNEPLVGVNTGGSGSPSGGAPSESSSGGGSGSPLNHSMGIHNNNSIPQGMPWK